MTFPSTFTDREQDHLAELAELDMALARHAHAHAHALASDEPAVIAEMGRTYQRAARSARQSLALCAKLRRDAARDAAEAVRLAERAVLLGRLQGHPEPDAYPNDDDAVWDEDDDGEGEDDLPIEAPPPAPIDPAVLQREAELRTAVRRLIWDERERLETEETEDDLFALLDERLESWRRRPTFCDPPLDAQVTELCIALSLPTERAGAWRDLLNPEPPLAPGAPEPQPQSSA